MTEPSGKLQPPAGAAGAARDHGPIDTIITPPLLASLLAGGDDDLAAWVLRHALEEAPRAAVFDGLLRQAMRLVGRRWQDGTWSVAEEHLASRSLAQALARVRPPSDPEQRIGPVAVLAAVAGERHVVGLQCLAQVLEERGWHVESLGADVPTTDLLRFVSERTPAMVALSVATRHRLPALRDLVASLRDTRAARGTALVVGGRGVEHLRTPLDGVDLVSTSLSEALAFADEVAAHLNPAEAPA